MAAVIVTLLTVGIVAGIIFYFARGNLEDAASIAHVVEGMAVLGALLFAGFEYLAHSSAEAAKSREAATTILLRSFDPHNVDDALGTLSRTYDTSYKATAAEDKFDDDTGSLMSYFWTIDACVKFKLCDLATVQDIYCDDYRKYSAAFRRIHGVPKWEAEFGELKSLNECLTPHNG